jgi:hypothetical protein
MAVTRSVKNLAFEGQTSWSGYLTELSMLDRVFSSADQARFLESANIGRDY